MGREQIRRLGGPARTPAPAVPAAPQGGTSPPRSSGRSANPGRVAHPLAVSRQRPHLRRLPGFEKTSVFLFAVKLHERTKLLPAEIGTTDQHPAVPDLELRDWRRYAESIKKHAAVRLSSALATRVQELHRAAGLEHAAPTDASACYFGKILQREAQSECGITNWYRSLHREGSQQIKNSTRELVIR